MEFITRGFAFLAVFICTGCGSGLNLFAPEDFASPAQEFFLYVGKTWSLEPHPGPPGAARFSISPTLPSGLELDKKSGAISGTPSAPTPYTVYTLSAENGLGSTQVSFALRVNESHTSPLQLGDLNTGAASIPIAIGRTRNCLLMGADDTTRGYELFKTDGTVAGTSFVKEIEPGASGSIFAVSFEKQPSTFSGTFDFFPGYDSVEGYELWRSDCTSSGTVRVSDLAVGAASSSVGLVFEFFGRFLFAGDDGTGDFDWRIVDSAGNFQGTINYFTAGAAAPNDLRLLNGFAVFQCSDNGVTHGWEVCRTDGTSAGTILVKDINPGSGDGLGGTPESFSEPLNGVVYFSADSGTTGLELWRTDGTPSGTYLVKDINAGATGSDPYHFTIWNGRVYFFANDGVNGIEFWRSDGTSAGTQMVIHIRPGALSAFDSSAQIHPFKGKLLLDANDGTVGEELWQSDGTSTGTQLLAQMFPGASGSDIHQFTTVGDVVFFNAVTTGNIRKVFKTDGTAAGTVQTSNINPSSDDLGFNNMFYHYQGSLIFAGYAGVDIEPHVVTPY